MAGILTQGDSLGRVTKTIDGVDLNQLWAEMADIASLWNDRKDGLVDLLCYKTTAAAEPVAQSPNVEEFEEASEFGVPQALSPAPDYAIVGFTLKDWDKASRMSWRFLRSATADQVRAQVTRLIEADRLLRQKLVLNRLFDTTKETNEFGNIVYGIYDGDTTHAMVPPRFNGQTFDATHSHFFSSGAPTLDSGDVENLINEVTHHGYGAERGDTILIVANPVEAEAISTWRAGIANANNSIAKFDFIPSDIVPAYLTRDMLVGQKPQSDINGLPVLGSYGRALLVESTTIPRGYVAVAVTGGPDSLMNPIALRQHVSPEWQGLRFLPGNQQHFPIEESFAMRTIGVGTRHRGAAAVMQVGTGTVYTAPNLNF